MKVLAIAILCLFGVVFAQDNCPLPTDAEIRSDIVGYLQSQSGDAGTPFTVTLSKPVQYTCLATGTVRDTYTSYSVVANFTSVPSTPVTLVHYQRRCNSGIWSAITGDYFEASVPNNLQPPTRTDCFTCTNQLGDPHHCRQCTPPCPGSGRCTGFGVCCPFFATDGTCTDNCTTSDGPNYIANAANDFVCSCSLTCPIGESPNANCTTCELSDICVRDSPCGSNGTCTLISAPDNYTCTCDDGFNFNNVTCHEVIIPTPSTVMSTSSTIMSTLTPSPICIVSSCDVCQSTNNSCCDTCYNNFTLSGCDCILPPSPSPTIDNDNCLSLIDGCLECNPLHCCSLCNDNYTLSGCSCISAECPSPHYVLNNSGNASCELDDNTNTYTCYCPLNSARDLEAVPIWFIVTIIVLLCVIMTGCIIIVVMIVLLVGLKGKSKSHDIDEHTYEDTMTVRHHHHHHQSPVITTNIAYDSIGHNN